MSDNVLIVLIIAVAVIVILILFRKQLSRFFIKANRDGVEAELQTTRGQETQPTPAGDKASVTISGNKQIGRENAIDVGRDDVAVEKNLQLGEGQDIKVRPDKGDK